MARKEKETGYRLRQSGQNWTVEFWADHGTHHYREFSNFNEARKWARLWWKCLNEEAA